MSQEPGESGPGFTPPAGPAPEQRPEPYPWPYGQAPGAQQPYGAPPPQGPPRYGQYAGGRPHGYGQAQVDPSLAEWWRRLVARLVDGLVVTLVTSPVLIWFFLWYFRQLPDLTAASSAATPDMAEVLRLELQLMGTSLLVGLAQGLVYFGYDWFQHARWGRTIGKRVMKIKVVALADRGPVTGGAAAKRAAAFALAPQVPLVGGPFGVLNTLWLLWDRPHRQCLHDKFARTIVIKTVDPN
ncbi:MAG: RDD family protein [Actinomadura sp.]